MSTHVLLDRLDGVRSRGPGSWMAKCPAHDDRSPSLSIRETSDGATLVYCFGGCSLHEVVGAVGLQIKDLFPANNNYHSKSKQPQISARDLLILITYRVTLLWIAAEDLAAGKVLSERDQATIRKEYAEIGRMLEVANGF